MQKQEILDKVYEFAITYGISLMAAILIFIIGKWAAKVLSRFVEKLMDKAKVEKTLASFVSHIVYFGLMVVVVIAALNKLGIQTTSFIAIIGAAGLAVGLALQGSLSNFAAGVLLVIFKPFKVGDFIEAGGVMGTVQEVQIFNTVLNAPDNRRIIVPNAQVTGTSITNFSDIKNRRIDLIFGISYSDSMKKAKEVLLEVVKSDPRILKDPAPVVAVSELGDSSVNLVCRPWVKPGDYWAVYFDVLEEGKEALESNGITIPFPQRDIHVYEEKIGKK
ncbi:MAG: mechanosensitive ion channel protein [Omnitrophica WOR_2 bacterium GWF2_38_59]|nr:MAG: mechanosensitive ion channel protein [Omnitrophica WOR_2 bacterium GWF2_38_59]OGX50348.1 MAG: mechanosensitive ion channel protein [Omnitrophica WOR_2 bacterium RIFOXYA2_FULL_38_17]OGX59272.1 MAG: mechanosensitive ion channel protein [Omnitrophica WOR_2 bacterium RIFOXYC2_FULL_38_12]OGX59720.1 MAG: mechanosensitive ion channel protein [Omnitrophica WOR_2 bacterium RIFOXYB2_FULL_38_16]HBG61274.1 mechanosensitive ion channel protein [Candidatus Omnitrophota bacterium]